LIVSEANLRQIRILHVVSSAAVAAGLQQSLLIPLLIRMPKQRVKTQVVCLAPGAVPAAVLRQNGVPVHDVALSRTKFSFGGFGELVKAAKAFRPDVIHAWGYTAQIFAHGVRKKVDRKIKVVWTVGNTTPLPRGAGLIDRQKIKHAVKAAANADRIVYASDAGGSQHRRVGFPEADSLTIPPGIDATRFKPDPAARLKIREQLHLAPDAFVVGMVAPFQPEYDHPTFLKGIGELIKTNPHIAVVLAGHGVQKGNAPLMALVGGGTMGGRTQLLGEWSDLASLFNACDVVCSSALNDGARMTLVAAMLCGVPCVATGMGAQGEVIGHYGVAIEAGSPAAFVKGIQRVLQLTPEKRAAMAQGARKHALQNYVYVRSLQRYLQLYYDLIGRQSLVTQEMPTPEIDATVPVPAKVGATADKRKPLVTMAELADPDSLETKVAEHSAESLPKWRLEQEQERSKREQELSAKIASSQSSGDVLQVFEAEMAKPTNHDRAFTERARGVADESEELLSMEAIAAPKPGTASITPAPTLTAPPPAAEPKPAPVAAPVAASPPPTPAPATPAPATPAPATPAPATLASAAPAPATPAPATPAPATPASAAPAPATPAPATPALATPASAASEPASVTQPLAALALLETPGQQPVQLGLLGDEPPAPAPEASPQLELLDDDRKRMSG
jgi:glycosyltransferase involved in cell wall biosynthesis